MYKQERNLQTQIFIEPSRTLKKTFTASSNTYST